MSDSCFTAVAGGRLRVRRSGQAGPAMVCLHAGVADSRMFSAQLEHFASNHRVLAYDRRGFGESQSDDVAFSHTADLEAIMDGAGFESAVLLGCSQGGRISIDFALENPARVSALVLAAPALSGADEPGEFEPPIDAFVREWEAAEESGDLGVINEFEARGWLDGPTSEAGRVSGPMRDLFLDMNGIALANDAENPLTKTIEPPSARERLGEISVPTLVVAGELDFPFVTARAAMLASEIATAEHWVAPGVAHLVPLEAASAFNQRVRDFLQG